MSAGRKNVETSASSKPIDYSKFNNIEDSDDEKETGGYAKAKSAPKAPEKAHCYNCQQDILKPLRCGVCKVATYCSQKCQKDDWSYHKRICKKPAPPKEADPPPRRDEAAPSKPARPKGEEKVVEDDKVDDWYRHREWKPA